jgi:hypothetical protein
VARTKAADLSLNPSPASAKGPHARIYVIFTDIVGTKAALLAAVGLAHGLDLPLLLLAARRVPYPLPVEEPPFSVEFTEHAMYGLVSDLHAEVAVQILLCREPEEALRGALGPEALVVIGTGKGWWKSRYRNLARRLRADGRHLVLID